MRKDLWSLGYKTAEWTMYQTDQPQPKKSWLVLHTQQSGQNAWHDSVHGLPGVGSPRLYKVGAKEGKAQLWRMQLAVSYSLCIVKSCFWQWANLGVYILELEQCWLLRTIVWIIQRNLYPSFLKRQWKENNKCSKMTAAGNHWNFSDTRKKWKLFVQIFHFLLLKITGK